jgi:hypothetical protein
MSEAKYDPKDLANGYYPHLRKVAVDDPEFLDIQSWLVSKGAPRFSRYFVPQGVSWFNEKAILPTEMVWEGAKKEANGLLRLDAALVFNFPHVALVELKKAFGFGDPNVLEMYPGFRQPVQYVLRSPIGAPWPEKGENAYRPSEADREPYGAVYADPTGRYVKERHSWAFISYGVWIKQ